MLAVTFRNSDVQYTLFTFGGMTIFNNGGFGQRIKNKN